MIIDAAERASNAIEKKALRQIDEIYSEALKTALKNQADFFKKLDEIDERAKKLPADWSPERVAEWKAGFYREAARKTQVVKNIAAEIAKQGGDVTEIIKDMLVDVYGVNRNWTIDEIQNVYLNVNFAMYDKNQIRVILQDEQSPFSKIAYKNLGNDSVIVRKLNNELAQATVLGESQQKIIKRISKVVGSQDYNAKRTAQTERTRVQSQGRMDTIDQAAKMGIAVKKEWSTRMVNSRESHIELNGKIVGYDEEFGFGLRFPGDPNAAAEQVINCHCVMAPIVE